MIEDQEQIFEKILEIAYLGSGLNLVSQVLSGVIYKIVLSWK